MRMKSPMRMQPVIPNCNPSEILDSQRLSAQFASVTRKQKRTPEARRLPYRQSQEQVGRRDGRKRSPVDSIESHEADGEGVGPLVDVDVVGPWFNRR